MNNTVFCTRTVILHVVCTHIGNKGFKCMFKPSVVLCAAKIGPDVLMKSCVVVIFADYPASIVDFLATGSDQQPITGVCTRVSRYVCNYCCALKY